LGSRLISRGKVVRMVSMRSGRKPISMARSFAIVLSVRPAPARSAKAAATSSTTSASRVPARAPPTLPRPPWRSPSLSDVLEICGAGTILKSTPAASDRPSVKNSKPRSRPARFAAANPAGTSLAIGVMPARDAESQDTACQRQQEALGDHLADEPAATGAERAAWQWRSSVRAPAPSTHRASAGRQRSGSATLELPSRPGRNERVTNSRSRGREIRSHAASRQGQCI